MAEITLKWSSLDEETFPDGRACLVIRFLDTKGQIYRWVPVWKNILDLMYKSASTEIVNKPKGQYASEFASVAKNIFDLTSKTIQQARLEHCFIEAIDQGMLVLKKAETIERYEPEIGEFFSHTFPGDELGRFSPAFELTQDWLLINLGKELRCLIINGIVVKVLKAEHE